MNKYINTPMSYIDLREMYIQLNNIKETKKEKAIVTMKDIKLMLKDRGCQLERKYYWNNGSRCYYIIRG